MIGMDGVLRIMELAVWTTALEGERNSVSLLVVAKPESGKSDALERFSTAPNVIRVNDMTTWGLTHEIFPKLYASKSPKAVLIPDFINVLSRNQASVSNLVQTFKSIMEEGVTAIHTKFMNFSYDHPIRAAILTSITPSEFMAHRKAWTKSGVLSRFLVISYEHSGSTQERVHEYLNNQSGTLRDVNVSLRLPAMPKAVHADGRLLRPLNKLVQHYQEKLGVADEGYGYRTQLHFQRLVAAHALASGRDTVEAIDVDSVSTLLELFANLDYQKV